MGPLERIWERVKRAFDAERAQSISQLYDVVWSQMRDSDAWLHDLYYDDGNLFAITSQEGLLYRTPIMMANGDVSLGEAQRVEAEFAASERAQRRGGFRVMRQADGGYRWFAIAETAVLLRVGEIDSTALFDTFVERAEEVGYPPLRFYHTPGLDFGQTDWLARDGACLLASGTLDMDNPLAQALVARTADGWGCSNGFAPDAGPEMLAVADGVTVPIYNSGTLREISVLPEDKAASWFTRVAAMGVTRMNSKVEEALRALLQDDDAAEEVIALVDGTNETIRAKGLITRDQDNSDANAEDAPVAENSEEEPEDEEEIPAEGVTIELTEEALSSIMEQLNAGPLAEMQAELEAVRSNAQEREAALQETISDLTGQVAQLARSDEEKQREWLADLPRSPVNRVTYRPRDNHADEPPAERSYADRIAEMEAKIEERNG